MHFVQSHQRMFWQSSLAARNEKPGLSQSMVRSATDFGDKLSIMDDIVFGSISVGRTVSTRTARISGVLSETRRSNNDISTVDVLSPASSLTSSAAQNRRHVFCFFYYSSGNNNIKIG